LYQEKNSRQKVRAGSIESNRSGKPVRAVDPLAAHERADLTRPRAHLRLAQDPQLVLGAEAPPLRPPDADQFDVVAKDCEVVHRIYVKPRTG
jgi:hypothetical protein